MKILIVDDEALAREELSYLITHSPSIPAPELLTAEDVHEAEDALFNNQVDLLFLDISLNDDNGFDLAKKLKQLAKPPLVIFATAYDDYAVKAFEIEAIDYILKPFEQERVDQALAKAAKALKAKAPSPASPPKDFISLEIAEHVILVKKSDLAAAVVSDGELTIYTRQGEYQLKQTLAWLKKKLPESNFLQIHRTTIVNLDQIKEIQPWFNHTDLVITQTGIKLPVGRSYLKDLHQRLGI